MEVVVVVVVRDSRRVVLVSFNVFVFSTCYFDSLVLLLLSSSLSCVQITYTCLGGL